MARPTKRNEPSKRILIDLPVWVTDAIEKECLNRKQQNKPFPDRKSYVEALCEAHVKQSLIKK